MDRLPARSTTSPWPIRSGVRNIRWPALPGVAASQVMAQLYQLEASQWWSPEELERRQFEQFGELVRFAIAQSEFCRRAVGEAGVSPTGDWTASAFRQLPLLSRRALLSSAAQIHSRQLPDAHGNVAVVETSGSSGEKVRVKRTGITELKWLALVMREHLWRERDFTQTLAAIRAHIPQMDDEQTARENGWGHPVTLLHETGPAYSQPLCLDVRLQARWLLERDPGYLLTYPTNLAALIDELDRIGERLQSLIEVRTVGETVSDELRERCKSRLGVPLVDVYSSQEVGPIAAQCPESGLYHVHAESLIVEVLDDSGAVCAPGEVGRVVITDLHNFAMPLIRYDIRDYAEVGPKCSCGRGLPTLRKIVGRERNMVRLPSGERYWPFVGYPRFGDVANVLQYQVVQHSLNELEVRLAVPAGLNSQQEDRLRTIVQEAIRYPFEIRFTVFADEIPRDPGGKFEEFVCLVNRDS